GATLGVDVSVGVVLAVGGGTGARDTRTGARARSGVAGLVTGDLALTGGGLATVGAHAGDAGGVLHAVVAVELVLLLRGEVAVGVQVRGVLDAVLGEGQVQGVALEVG